MKPRLTEQSARKSLAEFTPALIFRDFKWLKLVLGSLRPNNLRRTLCSVSYGLIEMREIRIHARAGQGAITTAYILGEAYFLKGMYAYAFPHFGAARMGAPMNAFVRVDNKPVRIRSQIYEPDFVIVVDSTIMRSVNCLAGLREDGVAIINQREGVGIPKPKLKQRIYVVPANRIAQQTIGRPLGNTALLGAYVAATGEIDLETLQEAIRVRLSGKMQEGNLEAVRQGFEFIKNK